MLNRQREMFLASFLSYKLFWILSTSTNRPFLLWHQRSFVVMSFESRDGLKIKYAPDKSRNKISNLGIRCETLYISRYLVLFLFSKTYLKRGPWHFWCPCLKLEKNVQANALSYLLYVPILLMFLHRFFRLYGTLICFEEKKHKTSFFTL